MSNIIWYMQFNLWPMIIQSLINEDDMFFIASIKMLLPNQEFSLFISFVVLADNTRQVISCIKWPAFLGIQSFMVIVEIIQLY